MVTLLGGCRLRGGSTQLAVAYTQLAMSFDALHGRDDPNIGWVILILVAWLNSSRILGKR